MARLSAISLLVLIIGCSSPGAPKPAEPAENDARPGGAMKRVPDGKPDDPAGAEANPEPDPERTVAQKLLEARRVSGQTQIQPPPAVRAAIATSGKDVVGVFKMCLGRAGQVTSVSPLRKTGYPAYDAAIEAGMRGWRYEPYRVDGKAVAVCTSVAFIYKAPSIGRTPQIVPFKALLAQLVSGDANPKPTAAQQGLISKSGRNAVGVFKLCVDAAGKPASVRLLRSTGLAALDGDLVATLEALRFRPFTVQGTPIAVCTSATFVFQP